MREVVWALGYAHARGVVHRDVKPDNILIESETERTLVMDFGIACAPHEPGVTGVGELLGTAEFMSPEQASGEDVDARSDIYALGVVGYYAISGKLPFTGPNVAAVLAKQITQEAPKLAEVSGALPRKLVQVIERCMSKERIKRFQSGEALADKLSEAVPAAKEIPVALRVQLKRIMTLSVISAVTVLVGLVMLALILTDLVRSALTDVASVLLILPLTVLVFAIPAYLLFTPPAALFKLTKRILEHGYGFDDFVAAVRDELRIRTEERTFEFSGEATKFERWMRGLWLLFGLLPIFVWVGELLLYGGRVQFDSADINTILFGQIFGVLYVYRYSDRTGLYDKLRAKFLSGRLVRWLFKLAERRVEIRGLAPGTHRSTEAAIRLAAYDLWVNLPKELRKKMGRLPAVVSALETGARKMRNRLDGLDSVLQGLNEAAPGNEIEEERDAIEQRHRDAVTALDDIRLGLIRLQAGTGGIETITADLLAGQELSEDVERLLEGRKEVERMLGDT